ncbi:MAG: hypothetical protein AB8C13_06250 [Phycisphaerales bacterium]
MTESGRGYFYMAAVVVSSFVAWIYIEYNARVAIQYIADFVEYNIGVYQDSFLLLVADLGYIWFPWLILLLARDRWFYRQIRKQLDGATCMACDYCLVGLEIQVRNKYTDVKCPECGLKNDIDGVRLSHVDIDPNFSY